jgi:hypothetical protein
MVHLLWSFVDNEPFIIYKRPQQMNHSLSTNDHNKWTIHYLQMTTTNEPFIIYKWPQQMNHSLSTNDHNKWTIHYPLIRNIQSASIVIFSSSDRVVVLLLFFIHFFSCCFPSSSRWTSKVSFHYIVCVVILQRLKLNNIGFLTLGY